MDPVPERSLRVPAALLAGALVVLYLSALRTGFLNDDYLFLEQARTSPLGAWIGRLDALGNYWRPLSRQVYFEVLDPIGGGRPLVFHLANFAAYLAALALLGDLLVACAGPVGAFAGLTWYALLPFQQVNLTWISCSQDLLALAGSLGALALWRRDRRLGATVLWAAAIACKESALPLPGALLVWDHTMADRSWRESFRRVAPLAVVGAVWLALVFAVRAHARAPLPLHYSPVALAAACVHLVQTLLGIEHPPGMLTALLEHPPALVPLILLGAAAWWIARGTGGGESARFVPRRVLLFSVAWLAAFTIPTWPVAHMWSGYFYTLAAAGAALPVALAARRIERLPLAALCAALLWWHAGGIGTRAFATSDNTWGWTSHLTSFYFDRGAALTRDISGQLRRIEPSPPRGTRFFFATLPPWSGFQMGNGALIRTLYRDPSLASHFYSQFSESTAADHPCRFFYWDGLALQPLYGGASDPFFQVGCDLLLLDRPAGAAHAFHRALAAGGRPEDNLYWLGWAEMWRGRRPEAEAAWRAFGAQDDSALATARFIQVRDVLYARRDTLAARRLLFESLRAGIGRSGSHAILGELLWARGGENARYGLLELKVATWLNPRDWLARRELIVGLTETRLDVQANAELDHLRQMDPDWGRDSLLRRAASTLERRNSPASVALFE